MVEIAVVKSLNNDVKCLGYLKEFLNSLKNEKH